MKKDDQDKISAENDAKPLDGKKDIPPDLLKNEEYYRKEKV